MADDNSTLNLSTSYRISYQTLNGARMVLPADSNAPEVIAERVSNSMTEEYLLDLIRQGLEVGLDMSPSIKLLKELYGRSLCDCQRCLGKTS